jgi:hypothetical protein
MIRKVPIIPDCKRVDHAGRAGLDPAVAVQMKVWKAVPIPMT